MKLKQYILVFSMFLLVFIALFHEYIIGSKLFIFQFPTNIDHLINYLPFRLYLLKFINCTPFNFQYAFGLGTNPFSLKSIYLDLFNLTNIFIKNQRIFMMLILFCKLLVAYLLILNILKTRINSLSVTKAGVFALFFVFNGTFIYWSVQDPILTQFIYSLFIWFAYENFKKQQKFISTVLVLSIINILLSVYIIFIFYSLFILFALLDISFDFTMSLNARLKLLLKLMFIFIISILLSSFSILPEIWVLAHNKRVSASLHILDYIHIKYYAQYILRGLGNKVVSNYYPGPHSGALWYTSSFIVVSALGFIFQQFQKDKKIFYSGLCAIVFFLLLPIIALFLNAFSDFTFRWSWITLIPIFICATQFWRNLEDASIASFRFAIICIFVLLTIATFCEYKVGDIDFKDVIIKVTYIEIIVVLLLFYILSYFKVRKYLFISMAIIGCFDGFFNNYLFLYKAQPIDADYQVKHQYYYDNTINAVNKIKSEDKSIFYRMDKTYSSLNLCPFCGLNENLIQGYNGVKQYISTPNPAYFKFSADMDAKPYYNFIFGFDGRNDLLRMLGVKYILSKSESSISGYSYQQKVDDINIYLANNYQGIGHVFHNYITYDNFMSLSTTDKDLAFSRCTILNNQQISAVKVEPVTIANCLARDSVLNNNSESFNLEVLNGRHVLGSVNLLSNGILYLAIPYDQGFSAKVDGKDVPVLNVSDGFVGLELTTGKHSIELDYLTPLLKIGLIISGLTLLTIIIYGLVKKKLVKTNNE